eukprot:g1121.t1
MDTGQIERDPPASFLQRASMAASVKTSGGAGRRRCWRSNRGQYSCQKHFEAFIQGGCTPLLRQHRSWAPIWFHV